jgi:hypothetical protein
MMPFVPYKLGTRKRYMKGVIWSPPGVGKTTFVASGADHPDIGKILIVNIEDGLLSLPDNDNIMVVDIGMDEKGNKVPDIARHLEDLLDEVLAPEPKEPWKDVKTIVIDSWSDFQTKSLQDILTSDGKAKDIDMLEQKHYGKDTNREKRLMSLLRQAKKNVLFTAIAKTNKDKEGNIIEVLPALSDKVAETLVSYVDFSWYLFEDKGTIKALTRPRSRIRAKTRRDDIAEAIGEVFTLEKGKPNLAIVYDKMKPYLDRGE